MLAVYLEMRCFLNMSKRSYISIGPYSYVRVFLSYVIESALLFWPHFPNEGVKSKLPNMPFSKTCRVIICGEDLLLIL